MNTKVYDEELELGMGWFVPVGDEDPPQTGRQVVVDCERQLTALTLDLIGEGTLKMAATEHNLHVLRVGVNDALRVLYACICRSRPEWSRDNHLQEFYHQVEKMRRLSMDKNHDYSPFNILKAGNLGLACRMGDKISRLSNVFINDVQLKVNESFIDTAVDLVNYAVYHVMIALDVWVTDEQRQWFRRYWEEAGALDLSEVYKPWGHGQVRVGHPLQGRKIVIGTP